MSIEDRGEEGLAVAALVVPRREPQETLEEERERGKECRMT